MSVQTNIEWTDATWNPVRGCTKVSPGCKHCYAETFAERFRGVRGHPYEQGFDLRLVPEKLAEPFSWRSPKLVFVNSMSDLFHEGVPDDYIEMVCRVMVTAKWHTYQVLTKRSARLRELLSSRLRFAAEQDHIWWGVSVEDRKYGLPRIDHLQDAPARVRFLSIEPLLEDLGAFNLAESVGRSSAGRAGRARVRCEKSGRSPSAISALTLGFRFSSSSGVASERPGTAGFLKAVRTTSTPHVLLHLFPSVRIARLTPTRF